MKDDGFNHVSDFVRVGVKSGGCSGLSYELKFDNKLLENDKVFERYKIVELERARHWQHGAGLPQQELHPREKLKYIKPHN